MIKNIEVPDREAIAELFICESPESAAKTTLSSGVTVRLESELCWHQPRVAAQRKGALSPRQNARLTEYSGNSAWATQRGKMTFEMRRDDEGGRENVKALKVAHTHMSAALDAENSADEYTYSKTLMTAFVSSSLSFASPRSNFNA